MELVWKDIVGFEGYHQISNKGILRSLDREIVRKDGRVEAWKGRILGHKTKEGYVISTLRVGSLGKHRIVRLHRLVAEAFIPNPENKLEVNHINEIKDDNRVENLEWCTRIENATHNDLHIRMHKIRLERGSYEKANETRIKNGFYKKAALRYGKPIMQFTMDGILVNEFPSAMEAFRQTGVRKCKDCARGDRNNAGGFLWKYKSDLKNQSLINKG